MRHKILRISLVLLLIVLAGTALISINHPIILKWLSGTARHIGKPIPATVYTDGKVNTSIEVFHVDRYWNGESADYYLVYIPDAGKNRLKFLTLNRKDGYAGSPVSTASRDYDLIGGHLFQSETGSKFSPTNSDIKGLGFDPQLSFNGKQITLNIPATATELKCDSIRIVL